MIKDNGGAAFPVFGVNCVRVEIDGATEWEPQQISTGMTLRDYFAVKAMQGMLAGNVEMFSPADILVKTAFDLADAMLEARK